MKQSVPAKPQRKRSAAKKALSGALLAAVLFALAGCGARSGGAVLPPARTGAQGELSPSLAQRYTFETACASSDLVAHIKVGSWLGEEAETKYTTYYEASVIEKYIGGETAEDIVLLQDGTSSQTLRGYPLFTSGNELLVFLRRAADVEYENAYWIIGSFTTVLDAVSDDSGGVFYMDRYGLLGETMDISENYASQPPAAQLYSAAAEQDPIIEDMDYHYPYIFSRQDVASLFERQSSLHSQRDI